VSLVVFKSRRSAEILVGCQFTASCQHTNIWKLHFHNNKENVGAKKEERLKLKKKNLLQHFWGVLCRRLVYISENENLQQSQE